MELFLLNVKKECGFWTILVDGFSWNEDYEKTLSMFFKMLEKR
jgi:pentatricopeptide repeat protein